MFDLTMQRQQTAGNTQALPDASQGMPDVRSATPQTSIGRSEPLTCYAENFEDVMLWRALQHVGSGFYIDIGACEPEAGSVTKLFYDRGWSGINIEPAAGPFLRIAAARPRDRNLRVLAGDAEGVRQFFLIGDENALSTAIPQLASRHAASGWPCRTTTMPMTTLARICDQHVSGQIHFLKIDAEWSELAILRGADFTRFRPWIVLFEATPVGSGPHSYQDCDRVLEQVGYRFLYNDGLNRFWAAEERYAEVAPHFATPPNVLDNFIRASEASLRTEVGVLQQRLDDALGSVQGAQAEIADLRRRLDETSAERDGYMQDLFEANRYAASLTVERQTLIDRANEANDQRAEAQARAASLSSQIDAMYHSTSWKVARPVRAAKRAVFFLRRSGLLGAAP